GAHYVSMVGFRFLNTRVRGITIPFHTDFEEVNLRFYVRRRADGEWRRGVVFIKELVPRRAIAAVARYVYGENYQSLPMRHVIVMPGDNHSGKVSYEWRVNGEWNSMSANLDGDPDPLAPGSEAEFIAEHYWGYTKQKDDTFEYSVEHPSWRAWSVNDATLHCEVVRLYPTGFAEVLAQRPASAFLADGSAVAVFTGTRAAQAGL
ncbi:MAG: DUF2071 domain-containing protein, partial [Candidatus Hydrogenedentes bacterium]|nr:DUF2071 domain-containing protein [Candidatus Hydrogenedentota bacterium]